MESPKIGHFMYVDMDLEMLYNQEAESARIRGCGSMVELQLPKLAAWVRFPSPAPKEVIFFLYLIFIFVAGWSSW